MPTLDWIGKKAVLNHHREVPYRLLKCDPKLSVGDPGSGNLLVQGDNLHALKALLPYYAGQVKLIYIDPPYNTGNENWVYNDAVNSPEMRAWLGKVVGGAAEDLSRHDKWLCMMYPRLQLLKQFLREDGVIFVSIDDNELHHLRMLIEEVFGNQNSIATLVWEKGKKGDAKFFSVTHEYIFVAARNKARLVEQDTQWRRRKGGIDQVLEKYQELRERHGEDHDHIRKDIMAWYRSLPKGHPAKAHKHYNRSDDRGLYFPDNFHGPDDGRKSRPRYDIIHPVTGKPCKKPSTGWRWEEPRTQRAMAETPPRIHFGPDHKTIPCRKSYLVEVSQEPFQSVFYKDGRAATLELEQMLGPGKLGFPKDSDILSELVAMLCGENDIVLDSFAGSGTTGHSVLKANHLDGRNHRFILVEMETDVCQSVTTERLRKAVEGYRPLSAGGRKRKGASVAGLGAGFRFCTLGEPLFDQYGSIRDDVKFPDLARHIYFTETGEPIPKSRNGKTPLLGVHNGTAVYLLFNGIIGDKSVNGGNVLTGRLLAKLPRPKGHDGPRVVYGEGCRLGAARLKREGITFKQIPYEIKVS